MAEVTYYFNSKSSDWENNPGNMIDGDIDTDASSTILDQIQTLNGNTCAGTDLGTITKVEIRAHGWISGGAGQVRGTPVFGGVDDGDEHNFDFFAEAWSSYVDITSDTNAPDWSVWTQIQNLDCDVKALPAGGTPFVSKVEIRVTYIPTFTSKASGNWDAEGETTWNEPGHPQTIDASVVIQNGHTVTLDSVATCYTLTIDSGGVLTDATNNVGLTVNYWTRVSGTLTCGSAAMSFGTDRYDFSSKLEIKAGGVFNGGTGNHIASNIESSTATSTLNMTSGTFTLNGSGATGYIIEISSDSTFVHNDGTLIMSRGDDILVDTQDLYNLTINGTGQFHLHANLSIVNNLTIAAATLQQNDDGGSSFGLIVGGDTDITGILQGWAGATNLGGNVTINAGGELEATTGTLTFSGTTWTNNGTFTHKDGTVVFDGTGQEIDGSNTWYHFTKAVAVADTLTIDNTSTQTLEKNVTLNGVVGQLLSLVSDSVGDAFNFTMAAGAVKTKLDYLSVKDSDASGSDAAHKPILPTNSVDVSGNTDWFSSGPVTKRNVNLGNYYY